MKPISIENVVRTYKFYAPLYDRLFGAVLQPGRTAMARKVALLNPASLLEVGVGTGLALERYPHTTAIVGIDISEEMLEVARARARTLGGRAIDLKQMDAENMSFADGSFDCVTLPYVLSVTPDPERLVSEVRRVCRKGGTILIVNHFSGSRFWWLLELAVRSLADRIGFRSSFTYEAQVLKYDWHVQSVEDVNLLRLSRLVVIRNT
jgi:phosphatidylethanolamine/phosphatidyl-N-methylethanolamine N-methyltransferase